MDPMSTSEVEASPGIEDWRVILGSLRTRFSTPDMSAGAALVAAIVDAANAANHHPDLALTYPAVDIALTTHEAGGLTMRDVDLARTISGLATEAGLTAAPGQIQIMEYAIDALDIDAVRPFWEAVTAQGSNAAGHIPARGGGMTIWFQQLDAPRFEQRNRVHLDIEVGHDVALDRVAAAVAAGGTLISDAAAPSFWVLADIEGNEVCICTAAGRD